MAKKSKTKKQKPNIVVSDYYCDHFVLSKKLAQEVVKQIGKSDTRRELITPDDEDGLYYVPFSNFNRLSKPITSALESLNDIIGQSFVDDCLTDFSWYADVKYQMKRYAFCIDKTWVIVCPMSLSLHELILGWDDDDDNAYWSDTLNALVIHDPSDIKEFQKELQTYSVVCSPRIESIASGDIDLDGFLAQHVKTATDNGYRAPDTFITNRVFEPHQRVGILGMVGLRQCILGDQVGLGKTGEFINAYLSIVQKKMEDGITDSSELWPCVISTKRSLKEEAAEEVVKWKGDAVVELLQGTSYTEIPDDVEFIVLNTDILASRLDNIIDCDPKAFIIDEAHDVKNETTSRSQAAQKLANYIRESRTDDDPLLILSSGTPFTSRPNELWSLLKILDKQDIFVDYAMKRLPSKFKLIRNIGRGGRTYKAPPTPKQAFDIRWCNGFSDRFGKWYDFGSSNEMELGQLLREHVMIRRKKSDVIKPLPPLKENLVLFPLPEESQLEYEDIANKFASWLKSEAKYNAKENKTSVRAAMRAVKVKIADPQSESMMRLTELRQQVAFFKAPLIVDWIERFLEGDTELTNGDETRRKLIVFYLNKEMQQVLVGNPRLKKFGAVSITAGSKTTQEAKRRFQEDDDCRLIICYSGAREGHTLTAAKDVLITEPPFVHTWIVQMVGRCWARFSEQYRPHEAYAHIAVAPNTVDMPIIRKNLKKRAVFNAIIDQEGEALEEVEKLPEDDGVDLVDAILSMQSGFKVAG